MFRNISNNRTAGKLNVFDQTSIIILFIGTCVFIIVWLLNESNGERAHISTLISGTIGVTLTFLSILIIAKTLRSQESQYSFSNHYELIKHFKDIFETFLKYKSTNPKILDELNNLIYNNINASKNLKECITNRNYKESEIAEYITHFHIYSSELKNHFAFNYIWAQLKYLQTLGIELDSLNSKYIKSIGAQLQLVIQEFEEIITYYDYFFFKETNNCLKYSEYMSLKDNIEFFRFTLIAEEGNSNLSDLIKQIIISPDKDVTILKICIQNIQSHTLNYQIAAGNKSSISQCLLSDNVFWTNLQPQLNNIAFIDSTLTIEISYLKSSDNAYWTNTITKGVRFSFDEYRIEA